MKSEIWRNSHILNLFSALLRFLLLRYVFILWQEFAQGVHHTLGGVLVERAADIGYSDRRIVLLGNLFHFVFRELPQVIHHLLELVQRDAVGLLGDGVQLGLPATVGGLVVRCEFIAIFSYILVHSTCLQLVFPENVRTFAMPEARVGMPMLPLDSSCVTVLSIGVPDWPCTHFSLRVMFMAMYLPIFQSL